MNKIYLMRGVVAALFTTAAAVSMAQGSSTGTPTSDAADRGTGSAKGKSSNDADTAASGAWSHKDKSHKDGKPMTGTKAKDAPAPMKGSGNADQNTPATNKPSTSP